MAQAATAARWAEPHFLVAEGPASPAVVMVYAPRNRDELEVVWQLVQASHHFACSACSGGGR